MSEYGLIPAPQFVMVRFNLLDNPAYDDMDARGIKLYLKQRRFIWRTPERGRLAEYYAEGWLVSEGYLGQWAEWLGVSKPTVGRILEQLETAGWIKWLHKSTTGGDPNVIAFGRWHYVAGSGEKVEIYYLDTLTTGEQETVSPVKHPVSQMEQTVSPVKPSNREQNREQNISSADAENTPPQQKAVGAAALDEFGLGTDYHEKHGSNGTPKKPGHWSARLRDEPWRGWSGGHFTDCDGVSAAAQERVGSLLERHTGEHPASDGQWNGWRNTVIEIYRASSGDWGAIERGIAEAARRDAGYVPHIASRKGEVNGWASAVARAASAKPQSSPEQDEFEFHRQRMLNDPQYIACGGD